jgi:hypothetical protein
MCYNESKRKYIDNRRVKLDPFCYPLKIFNFAQLHFVNSSHVRAINCLFDELLQVSGGLINH